MLYPPRFHVQADQQLGEGARAGGGDERRQGHQRAQLDPVQAFVRGAGQEHRLGGSSVASAAASSASTTRTRDA